MSGDISIDYTKWHEYKSVTSVDLKDDDDVKRERRALAIRGNLQARKFAGYTNMVKRTVFKAYCQSMYAMRAIGGVAAPTGR